MNHLEQVDLTFTSGAQVAWSDVVWLAQVKTSLNSKEDYEEALGQVSDRAQTLFNMQPERKWVIAALLGSSSMEVLRLPRYSDQDRIKRTGLMPLTGVSSPQGLTGAPAARSLLQLIVATEEDFGFKHPFLPQPFSLKSGSDHLDLYEFECLRISKDADSVSAYKAMVKSRSSPQVPVKPVVVKFGKEATINKEVSVLKLLSTHNIQFTPRLICHGKSPDLRSCLVIEPVGHLIGSGDFPPAVIGQVALDIATTIIDLSKVGILHCDVSAGNVLVTDEGRGLLVDYGSSLEGAHVGSHRVTGKPMKCLNLVVPHAFFRQPLLLAHRNFAFQCILCSVG